MWAVERVEINLTWFYIFNCLHNKDFLAEADTEEENFQAEADTEEEKVQAPASNLKAPGTNLG